MEGWVVDAYAAVETRLEEEQPDQRPAPSIIERGGRLLQLVGAVQLGLLVATGCIFVCFIILNLLFHMQP